MQLLKKVPWSVTEAKVHTKDQYQQSSCKQMGVHNLNGKQGETMKNVLISQAGTLCWWIRQHLLMYCLWPWDLTPVLG